MGIERVEAVITCEGNLSDPEFPKKFGSFLNKLSNVICQDKRKEKLKVLGVEPWNSVRVTVTLPKDAAVKLRQLAQAGGAVLKELGILSVQLEGDQVISLTLAGREPQEIVFKTPAPPLPSQSLTGNNGAFAVVQNQASSSNGPLPGSSLAHFDPKNVSELLSQAVSLLSDGNLLGELDLPPVLFKTPVAPNVVASSSQPIQFTPPAKAGTSRAAFPFASMQQAMPGTSGIRNPPANAPPVTRYQLNVRASAAPVTTSQPTFLHPAAAGITKPLSRSYSNPGSSSYSAIPGSSSAAPQPRPTGQQSSPVLANLLQNDFRSKKPEPVRRYPPIVNIDPRQRLPQPGQPPPRQINPLPSPTQSLRSPLVAPVPCAPPPRNDFPQSPRLPERPEPESLRVEPPSVVEPPVRKSSEPFVAPQPISTNIGVPRHEPSELRAEAQVSSAIIGSPPRVNGGAPTPSQKLDDQLPLLDLDSADIEEELAALEKKPPSASHPLRSQSNPCEPLDIDGRVKSHEVKKEDSSSMGIKLRLKLGKSEPSTPSYTVDILNDEPPRVPPLCISLKNRNVTLLSPKKDDDNAKVKLKEERRPKKRKVGSDSELELLVKYEVPGILKIKKPRLDESLTKKSVDKKRIKKTKESDVVGEDRVPPLDLSTVPDYSAKSCDPSAPPSSCPSDLTDLEGLASQAQHVRDEFIGVSVREPDRTKLRTNDRLYKLSVLNSATRTLSESECETIRNSSQVDAYQVDVAVKSDVVPSPGDLNSGNNQGEDSGIESMDALSEKSPNQGESPARTDLNDPFVHPGAVVKTPDQKLCSPSHASPKGDFEDLPSDLTMCSPQPFENSVTAVLMEDLMVVKETEKHSMSPEDELAVNLISQELEKLEGVSLAVNEVFHRERRETDPPSETVHPSLPENSDERMPLTEDLQPAPPSENSVQEVIPPTGLRPEQVEAIGESQHEISSPLISDLLQDESGRNVGEASAEQVPEEGLSTALDSSKPDSEATSSNPCNNLDQGSEVLRGDHISAGVPEVTESLSEVLADQTESTEVSGGVVDALETSNSGESTASAKMTVSDSETSKEKDLANLQSLCTSKASSSEVVDLMSDSENSSHLVKEAGVTPGKSPDPEAVNESEAITTTVTLLNESVSIQQVASAFAVKIEANTELVDGAPNSSVNMDENVALNSNNLDTDSEMLVSEPVLEEGTSGTSAGETNPADTPMKVESDQSNLSQPTDSEPVVPSGLETSDPIERSSPETVIPEKPVQPAVTEHLKATEVSEAMTSMESETSKKVEPEVPRTPAQLAVGALTALSPVTIVTTAGPPSVSCQSLAFTQSSKNFVLPPGKKMVPIKLVTLPKGASPPVSIAGGQQFKVLVPMKSESGVYYKSVVVSTAGSDSIATARSTIPTEVKLSSSQYEPQDDVSTSSSRPTKGVETQETSAIIVEKPSSEPPMSPKPESRAEESPVSHASQPATTDAPSPALPVDHNYSHQFDDSAPPPLASNASTPPGPYELLEETRTAENSPQEKVDTAATEKTVEASGDSTDLPSSDDLTVSVGSESPVLEIASVEAASSEGRMEVVPEASLNPKSSDDPQEVLPEGRDDLSLSLSVEVETNAEIGNEVKLELQEEVATSSSVSQQSHTITTEEESVEIVPAPLVLAPITPAPSKPANIPKLDNAAESEANNTDLSLEQVECEPFQLETQLENPAPESEVSIDVELEVDELPVDGALESACAQVSEIEVEVTKEEATAADNEISGDVKPKVDEDSGDGTVEPYHVQATGIAVEVVSETEAEVKSSPTPDAVEIVTSPDQDLEAVASFDLETHQIEPPTRPDDTPKAFGTSSPQNLDPAHEHEPSTLEGRLTPATPVPPIDEITPKVEPSDLPTVCVDEPGQVNGLLKKTRRLTRGSKTPEVDEFKTPVEDIFMDLPEPVLRSTRSGTRLVSPDVSKFEMKGIHLKNSPSPAPEIYARRGTRRKREDSGSSLRSDDRTSTPDSEMSGPSHGTRSGTPETARPGKRKCSENASELIKVCMGVDDRRRSSLNIEAGESELRKRVQGSDAMKGNDVAKGPDADSTEEESDDTDKKTKSSSVKKPRGTRPVISHVKTSSGKLASSKDSENSPRKSRRGSTDSTASGGTPPVGTPTERRTRSTPMKSNNQSCSQPTPDAKRKAVIPGVSATPRSTPKRRVK